MSLDQKYAALRALLREIESEADAAGLTKTGQKAFEAQCMASHIESESRHQAQENH